MIDPGLFFDLTQAWGIHIVKRVPKKEDSKFQVCGKGCEEGMPTMNTCTICCGKRIGSGA